MWKRGGFKYLGVYLGDEATVKKNWEGVIEKVERRLKKWRWLSPQMSFRGRCLIINNLVASLLWHRFTCVEPPAGLLRHSQSILVDLFWDKLHWVAQSGRLKKRANTCSQQGGLLQVPVCSALPHWSKRCGAETSGKCSFTAGRWILLCF